MSEDTFKHWLISGSVFIWNDDLLQRLLIKGWRHLVLFSWTFLCMSTCPHAQQKKCMHIYERIFLEEPISLPVEKMIHSVIYYWCCWHHSNTDWFSSVCCFPRAWFIRDPQHVRPRKWLLLHYWGGGRSIAHTNNQIHVQPNPHPNPSLCHTPVTFM